MSCYCAGNSSWQHCLGETTRGLYIMEQILQANRVAPKSHWECDCGISPSQWLATPGNETWQRRRQCRNVAQHVFIVQYKHFIIRKYTYYCRVFRIINLHQTIILDYIIILSRVHSVIYRRAHPHPHPKDEAPCSPKASCSVRASPQPHGPTQGGTPLAMRKLGCFRRSQNPYILALTENAPELRYRTRTSSELISR